MLLLLLMVTLLEVGQVSAVEEFLRTTAIGPSGDVESVYGILERILPGERDSFTFRIASKGMPSTVQETKLVGSSAAGFTVNASSGKVHVTASGTNELAAGLGFYLREYCSCVIGWPRGGGSRIVKPKAGWPDASFAKTRIVPWSYAMNVCTHSYTLVWYGWAEWEQFIDWMALSGINNYLAETGQEEVAYKVLKKLGLNDTTIRNWFNGPALLTWSRGQNEYGGDIAGPLPRSWMRSQWSLQKKILNRTRALGMVGQLPAFQAAVPAALKAIKSDSNMTDNGQGTAWLDSLDPLFLTIAGLWMETMIADFGTDHWYQLDGYFNGGTAPWDADVGSVDVTSAAVATGPAPPSAPTDPNWPIRGAKAWASLANTDKDAVWSFQGWAINNADKARDMMHGFIGAVPKGQFSIIDMASDGRGEWHSWLTNPDGSPDLVFSNANFIWTSLHDFGGSDSLRGNLTAVNEIPFAALEPEKNTSVWGTGFTPEGLDQNPAFYEMLIEQNWRTERVNNISNHLVERAHRRYGLATDAAHADPDVTKAWGLLAESAYKLDLWGMDSGGTTHIPGTNYNNYAWENIAAEPCVRQHCAADYTKPIRPTLNMCMIFSAWEAMLAASARIVAHGNVVSNVNATYGTESFAKSTAGSTEPFVYDLVNTGREVLNQLMLPTSQIFNMSLNDTVSLQSTSQACKYHSIDHT